MPSRPDTARPQGRPRRADAERNHERLLDAAAEAFAERGLEVSVAEIARRAGVGQGTVFRHFPSKDRLVAAVACDRLAEITAAGEELSAAERPGEALLELLRRGVALQVRDRGFFEAACGSVAVDKDFRAQQERLLDVLCELVVRAQQAGEIREDVAATDILLLMAGIVQAAGPMQAVTPELWRRYVDLVFDGLRPGGATPLSVPAPSRDEVDAACAARVPTGRACS